MFYVSCKCGSRDVHHYRYKANSNTLNQFCGSCKINMTQLAVAKARKTRSKTLKMPRTASKRTKSTHSTSYALGLVGWAFFALSTFALTAYAEMAEPLVYEANKVPQFVSPVVEDVKKPETIVQKPTTPEEVKAYVKEQATLAGVHVEKVLFIVENESHYKPEAVGDTHLTCKRTGKPIRARGIFQITDCWYPNVTDEQAHSVEWSTKFALDIISQSKRDCISQWSTCRAWYNRK